jgi:carbamoyl-phosphate synthase large subunit
MLFLDDELLKFACAERIKYFAGHLVLSGITGNTCEGRLINDERVRETAEKCLRLLGKKTGETLRGVLTVDLRESRDGTLLVTEVNLRHVAFTSAFAAGGANMAEAQLLATMGLTDKIDRKEVIFPSENLFLRDIDGLPLWVENWQDPKCTMVTSRIWELADSCHDDRGEHQSKYPSCLLYLAVPETVSYAACPLNLVV